MITALLFVYTFVVSFLNLFVYLSIIAGKKRIQIPPTLISNNGYVFLPAFGYQVYFWFHHIGVI